jgi:hypothetical protein
MRAPLDRGFMGLLRDPVPTGGIPLAAPSYLEEREKVDKVILLPEGSKKELT